MSIRMRHTRGHTNNRRSHHALTATNVIADKETGALRLPHRIDEATGMYRGKQIAPARVARVSSKEVKAASTAPAAPHVHDHTHDHENAEVKGSKGIAGKLTGGAKPKARSGAGGGGA